MRGKELELEQAAEAYRNLQWLKQQSEEKEKNTLREKDAIINQLQAALQSRSQETQVIMTLIVCCVFISGKTSPGRKTCVTAADSIFCPHACAGSDSCPGC